jgi:hypothetical protein
MDGLMVPEGSLFFALWLAAVLAAGAAIVYLWLRLGSRS